MPHNPVTATKRFVECGRLEDIDGLVGKMVRDMAPPTPPRHDDGPVLATSANAVLVPIRGTEYLVHHAVSAEMCRLRDGVRGSLALVEAAMQDRRAAIALLTEILGGSQTNLPTAAQLADWQSRAEALTSAGEG